MKNFLKILISPILCIILFSSCSKEKGCTDKKAINFNATADEDDGSYFLCSTFETKFDSVNVYLKDKNFGSPYYNQNVAKFYLSQYLETPNDEVCGKESCKVTLTVESLIGQNLYCSYYSVSKYSGPVYISYSNDMTLNAHEFLNVGVIETFNNPPFLGISLDSILVTANTDIIYY